MKRSVVNNAIDEAIELCRVRSFPLPVWAYWTPEEWKTKGSECDEICDLGLGWDITDFKGSARGDFYSLGRVLFTLRNGSPRDSRYPKEYAEKAIFLYQEQKSPIHCHRSKREDITNRGSGDIVITLWQSKEDGKLSDVPFDVSVSGVVRTVLAGEMIRLAPGDSVAVHPSQWHQFWCENGRTLSSEVSSICDDMNDNHWLQPPVARFPEIAEDEPARYVLCNEYQQSVKRQEARK